MHGAARARLLGILTQEEDTPGLVTLPEAHHARLGLFFWSNMQTIRIPKNVTVT